MSTAVLILNWNGKEDTLSCLASLSHMEGDFTPVVIDNGSTDDSIEAILSQFPLVQVIKTGKNLGYAGGNNAGLEWALALPCEWFLILNNDTTVDPGLLKAFERHKGKKKVLGAKIYKANSNRVIDHFGGMFDQAIGDFIPLGQGATDDGISFEGTRQVDYVTGCALFFHRSLLSEVGYFDPLFFLLWEEADLCFRAAAKGFAIEVVGDAIVWHKVSASFTGGKPQMHYYWWRNRLRFLERHFPKEKFPALYASLIKPEMRKTIRHLFLRLPYLLSQKKRGSWRRLFAGAVGIWHAKIGRFGKGPKWIAR